MLMLNGLPRLHHPVFEAPPFLRASRDRFFILIEATDPQFDESRTREFLHRDGPPTAVDHADSQHGGTSRMKRLPHIFLLTLMTFAAAACKRDDMADQPRVKPYAASAFYANAAAARPLISGTVTTAGVLNDDDRLPWSSPLPETAPLPFAPTLTDLTAARKFSIFTARPATVTSATATA